MIAFGIAGLRGHVYHTRQAAAVTRGKRRLVERHIANGRHVEGRKQTAEVVHLIDRVAVDEKQVLVVVATAHHHARQSLESGRNTGLHLQGLDQIHLTHDGRNTSNLFGSQEIEPHGGIVHFVLPTAYDQRTVQFDRTRRTVGGGAHRIRCHDEGRFAARLPRRQRPWSSSKRTTRRGGKENAWEEKKLSGVHDNKRRRRDTPFARFGSAARRMKTPLGKRRDTSGDLELCRRKVKTLSFSHNRALHKFSHFVFSTRKTVIRACLFRACASSSFRFCLHSFTLPPHFSIVQLIRCEDFDEFFLHRLFTRPTLSPHLDEMDRNRSVC